jgi:hypothetical protein
VITSDRRIGIMTLAQAVFDAISVMKAVNIITIIRIPRLSKLSNPFNCFPIQGESPEASAASERAKPPPALKKNLENVVENLKI